MHCHLQYTGAKTCYSWDSRRNTWQVLTFTATTKDNTAVLVLYINESVWLLIYHCVVRFLLYCNIYLIINTSITPVANYFYTLQLCCVMCLLRLYILVMTSHYTHHRAIKWIHTGRFSWTNLEMETDSNLDALGNDGVPKMIWFCILSSLYWQKKLDWKCYR